MAINRYWRQAVTTGSNNLQLAIEDMIGTHDAHPKLVSSYANWYGQGRINRGNTPGAQGFTKAQFAGTIFLAAGTNVVANTRVNIKDVRLYILYGATGL